MKSLLKNINVIIICFMGIMHIQNMHAMSLLLAAAITELQSINSESNNQKDTNHQVVRAEEYCDDEYIDESLNENDVYKSKKTGKNPLPQQLKFICYCKRAFEFEPHLIRHQRRCKKVAENLIEPVATSKGNLIRAIKDVLKPIENCGAVQKSSVISSTPQVELSDNEGDKENHRYKHLCDCGKNFKSSRQLKSHQNKCGRSTLKVQLRLPGRKPVWKKITLIGQKTIKVKNIDK